MVGIEPSSHGPFARVQIASGRVVAFRKICFLPTQLRAIRLSAAKQPNRLSRVHQHNRPLAWLHGREIPAKPCDWDQLWHEKRRMLLYVAACLIIFKYILKCKVQSDSPNRPANADIKSSSLCLGAKPSLNSPQRLSRIRYRISELPHQAVGDL